MISASRHLGLVHNCLAAGADMCAELTPTRTRPILHGAEWLSPRLTLIITPDPKMTSPPDRDINAGPGPDTLTLTMPRTLILIPTLTLTPTPTPTALT